MKLVALVSSWGESDAKESCSGQTDFEETPFFAVSSLLIA